MVASRTQQDGVVEASVFGGGVSLGEREGSGERGNGVHNTECAGDFWTVHLEMHKMVILP